MIGRLSGTLVETRPDRALVDVSGVGYDVAIPLGTYTALPPAGERATLFVHTHVREDAILLYGFATAQEKLVFERLLTVSGIGPRVALTVLSGLPLPELVAAIAAQNAKKLATIPGVGKKLAERLGVELKEKMADLAFGAAPERAAGAGGLLEDAVGALVNLGYKAAQAEAAVLAAAKSAASSDLPAILSTALKSLAKS